MKLNHAKKNTLMDINLNYSSHVFCLFWYAKHAI